MARAADVAASVNAELAHAERAVEDFERAPAEGVVDPDAAEGLVQYSGKPRTSDRG